MIITVKTLQNQQFTVNAESTDTIAAIKAKIEQSQGDKAPAAHQKLIHSGKVLDDSVTVGASGYKETEFLVLMVRKPKEEPAKPAPAPTPAAQPAPVQPAPVQPTQPTQPAVPAAQPTQPAASSDASSLVTGGEYESTVARLCEMGFPREDVVKAMRAAFNNPDRAAEYLMTGIPNIPDMPAMPAAPRTPTQPAAPTQPTQPVQPTQPASPQTPTSGGGRFDFLRQNPQFNALRFMVQQNPELLQPVLQQLGQTNPAILQLINQHQQEFINLLNEPVNPATLGNLGGLGGMGGMGGTPGTPPSGAQYIQVTAEEKAAIDRLEKMGFDRASVIEAFFACDKNEELAANYLLEHQFEDYDDDDQTNQ